MQLFINEKNNVVTEAIDGLIQGSSGRLSRLDGYSHQSGCASDWDRSKVALISVGDQDMNPPMPDSWVKVCSLPRFVAMSLHLRLLMLFWPRYLR